jgi:hypothetical protein
VPKNQFVGLPNTNILVAFWIVWLGMQI